MSGLICPRGYLQTKNGCCAGCAGTSDYREGYDRGRSHRTNGDDPACGSNPEDSNYARGYWDGYGLRDAEVTA